MNYLKLLEENESEYLDFKSEWYKENKELIFDILCMANSDASSDRYLIIGVKTNEKTHKKTFYNITRDINRKSHENITQLLLDNSINRLPLIRVEQIKHSRKTLDIIIISNTSNKPYFLLQDLSYTKCNKNRVIRAGVVYTRNGGVNTPINSTASEYQIAKMWEERFGLTLPPINRLKKYVYDTENWEYYDDEYGNSIAFYKPFPEFTAYVAQAETTCPRNKEGWLNTIGESYDCKIIFKYHTTIIKTLIAAHVDNFKYIAVTPDWYDIYYTKDLSEVVLWHFMPCLPPDGHSIEELCQSGKYLHTKIYYHIIGSFDWAVMLLFSTELCLKQFYTCCGHAPFDKVYLFSKHDNIEKACRQLFIDEIKKTMHPE